MAASLKKFYLIIAMLHVKPVDLSITIMKAY